LPTAPLAIFLDVTLLSAGALFATFSACFAVLFAPVASLSAFFAMAIGLIAEENACGAATVGTTMARSATVATAATVLRRLD